MTCTARKPRLLLPRKTATDPHLKAAAYGARHARHLKRPYAAAAAAVANARPVPAGGFDFPVQLVGSTPDGLVTVYFDPTVGAQAQSVAETVFGLVDAA